MDLPYVLKSDKLRAKQFHQRKAQRGEPNTPVERIESPTKQQHITKISSQMDSGALVVEISIYPAKVLTRIV